MSSWALIQVVFDIFAACGLFVVVMRMNRAPKDDPRLSRGLALLQSKISVLEDLSDRTDAQVQSLISVLESKAREVQAKVELAERHVAEIRVSMDRSLEVASIFQDKIPHKEIIERQNTLKYVTAARLAHSGVAVDEIATQVDLPRAELEFIASVNRERLMFAEDELPEWAKGATGAAASTGAAGSAGLADAVGADDAAALALSAGAGSSRAAGVTAPELVGTAFASQAFAAAPMSGLAFEGESAAGAAAAEAGPIESTEDRARRMRAEIELAENQRLVENLSRLQFEMQALDMQLARENQTRDLASAYEVPRVETDHLKKLGEEFRKAVREGELADAKQPFGNFGAHAAAGANPVGAAGAGAIAGAGPTAAPTPKKSFLPPIENLAALIPSILEAGAVEDTIAPPAPRPAPTAATPAPVAPAVAAAKPAPNAQRAAAYQTPTPAAVKPQDPVLARAVAQAKVQAALRATAKPTSVVKSQEYTELTKARAVARDLAGNPVPAAKPGEVRKVMFPRIDGSDV